MYVAAQQQLGSLGQLSPAARAAARRVGETGGVRYRAEQAYIAAKGTPTEAAKKATFDRADAAHKAAQAEYQARTTPRKITPPGTVKVVPIGAAESIKRRKILIEAARKKAEELRALQATAEYYTPKFKAVREKLEETAKKSVRRLVPADIIKQRVARELAKRKVRSDAERQRLYEQGQQSMHVARQREIDAQKEANRKLKAAQELRLRQLATEQTRLFAKLKQEADKAQAAAVAVTQAESDVAAAAAQVQAQEAAAQAQAFQAQIDALKQQAQAVAARPIPIQEAPMPYIVPPTPEAAPLVPVAPGAGINIEAIKLAIKDKPWILAIIAGAIMLYFLTQSPEKKTKTRPRRR